MPGCIFQLTHSLCLLWSLCMNCSLVVWQCHFHSVPVCDAGTGCLKPLLIQKSNRSLCAKCALRLFFTSYYCPKCHNPTACSSPLSLLVAVARRSKLQGEICVTLCFQTPPRYLAPSGLLPPRWVACSNSSNSESDINASATSRPEGRVDLQNTSDARRA